MKKLAKLLFLGTGGSMGTPVIGCRCDVCQSKSPFNKRSRPGALITVGCDRYLIDASQDLRTQALQHGIDDIRAVLFTHAHYDHTAGIDDLRVYHMWHKKPVPCLLSEETAKDLYRRYEYIFGDHDRKLSFTSKLNLTILKSKSGDVSFEGLQIRYFTYEQLYMPVNGFRFGELAYVTDIKKYQETIFDELAGVSTLVVSALRHTDSPMHQTVEEAVKFAKKVGAKNTWLTHIAHDLDHEETNRLLPPNIQLSHDGLEIEFMIEGNE